MADYHNYSPDTNQQPMYNPPQYQPQPGMAPPPGYPQKSRVAAGILAILLGHFGIHSFYLGNTSRGLMQLLISLLTCGVGWIIMSIWASWTASSSWTAASISTQTAYSSRIDPQERRRLP